jgi:hypothetical protein
MRSEPFAFDDDGSLIENKYLVKGLRDQTTKYINPLLKISTTGRILITDLDKKFKIDKKKPQKPKVKLHKQR